MRTMMLLALILLPAPTSAQAGEGARSLTEEQVRRISDAEYAALLAAAGAKGWSYSADQVASGRARHRVETRARLVNVGVIIRPAEAARRAAGRTGAVLPGPAR
jgi:hypothetical protein